MQTFSVRAVQSDVLQLVDGLNSKQRRTLEAVFTLPVRSDITWVDLESLFLALGASVRNAKRGSGVRVVLNDKLGHFHKPHPEKEVCQRAVDAARDLLEDAGAAPKSES
ncbi:MAG: type II toxin-antitoxin system HicA family toxin [Crinalium sp.]